MTDRRRLPNRRLGQTFDFVHNDAEGGVLFKYIVTLGYFADDGALGEIFVATHRVGTDRDISIKETSIAISFALQHGCAIADIHAAMPRDAVDRAEGVIGALLDYIVREGLERIDVTAYLPPSGALDVQAAVAATPPPSPH